MPSDKVLVLDGGMSRELMRIGAPFKQPEWSALALMEAPQLVQQVHEEFAEANADILTTNSYALVPFHIGEDTFNKRGQELASLSGKLARAAADKVGYHQKRRVLIAGGLPPIFGSYRPDLFDGTQVQKYLSVLVEGLQPWVDVWLGETISLIVEAEAVAAAVEHTSQPLWLSFTIEDESRTPEEPATLRSGELVSEAVRKATELGASAVLFNCSRPEYMGRAIKDAKRALEGVNDKIQIGVYANAFEPKPDQYAANEGISECRIDLDEHAYAEFTREWMEQGATIIGGCCGIGCDTIAKIATVVKS